MKLLIFASLLVAGCSHNGGPTKGLMHPCCKFVSKVGKVETYDCNNPWCVEAYHERHPESYGKRIECRDER